MGRPAQGFREVVERHYAGRRVDRLASTWAKGLAHRLTQMHHDQWLVRNDFVHGKNEEGMTRDARQALWDRIDAEFVEGPDGLEDKDSHLFSHSYSEVMEWTSSDQRQWVLEVEAARKCVQQELDPTPPPAVERTHRRRRTNRLTQQASGVTRRAVGESSARPRTRRRLSSHRQQRATLDTAGGYKCPAARGEGTAFASGHFFIHYKHSRNSRQTLLASASEYKDLHRSE